MFSMLLHVMLVKVRFLADLVNAKVVASSSIMTLFDTFITVTYEPDIPHVSLSLSLFLSLLGIDHVCVYVG